MKPLVMDSTLDILVILGLENILAGVLLILGSDLEA